MQAIQQRRAKPTTPPGRRIFAIGDIHGRIDLLEELLGLIENHATSDPREADTLVFLGDYVDRGPASREVIERLSRPAPRGFEIVCLKGNHEEMMLQFLAGEDDPFMWLRNGGVDTLKSYGVEDPSLENYRLSEAETLRIRQALCEAIPGSHIEFLGCLDLMHIEGDYAMVHAGIKPGVALADQDEQDLIWIRGAFLNSHEDFGKVVIHGHSITVSPTVEENRIGIDTGAWRTDVLTCLVLDGEQRHFLST